MKKTVLKVLIVCFIIFTMMTVSVNAVELAVTACVDGKHIAVAEHNGELRYFTGEISPVLEDTWMF